MSQLINSLNTIEKDELDWNFFSKESKLDLNNLPNKCSSFNRLIMHTNNFFVIAGYGAFNNGYLILIPKKLVSSFSQIENNLLKEFYWLKDFTKKVLLKVYSEFNVAIFEHGLCACLGGLDRAHLHFMPYHKDNENIIIKSINHSLLRRRIGDQIINFENYKLTNPDDINFFLNNPDKSKRFKISGKQYKFEDIKSNYKVSEYPKNIYVENDNGKPYIYFDSGYENSSFITFENIETQFGREIVFNIDYQNNNSLKNFIMKNNIQLQSDKEFYWRWQDYKFEVNIINTIKNISMYLFNNYSNLNNNEYNLISFK